MVSVWSLQPPYARREATIQDGEATVRGLRPGPHEVVFTQTWHGQRYSWPKRKVEITGKDDQLSWDG